MFRDAEGTLPVSVSTIAHVAVTRVAMREDGPEAEVLVPPKPGRSVRRADEADRELALYFDKMRDSRFPAGLSRDGNPVYGNLEFLDGTRGAHVNISGISGVATKTTYALFLLYGLFHSSSLANAHSTHAIIFNVVFAALITPADVLTMLLVMVPLLLLYEIGVVCSYLFASRKPAPAKA